MGRTVTAAQRDTFRSELREGYTVEAVAVRHAVTPQTVKAHAGYEVGGRCLLVGTEVHIDGQRGRWSFCGDVGSSREGEQHATFINARTGRSRIFRTALISRVHRT